ncbi:MAG: hypothetical protein Q8K58_08265 [Acidimicrobiales bacterium]|nr:hypothetical protein [Acidimicrobiales bacterium]
MSANETTVPIEDRLRGDKERRPPLARNEVREQSDERPVRPGEAGPCELATEDCELVAQHQNLCILGEAVRREKSGEPEGAVNKAVEERERHSEAASPGPSWLVKVLAVSF